MVVLERFVVLIYDLTSSLTKVNETLQKLFLKRSRSLDSIPPTKASLQHVKRAVFQGGCVWGQTLLGQPVLPSPSDWGWQQLNNSHRQRNLVTNSFDVDAEPYVEDDASA